MNIILSYCWRLLSVLSIGLALAGCNIEVGIDSETQTFTIGGSVKALDGELVLVLNDDETITVNENGRFQFSITRLPVGGEYRIGIKQQPATQNCALNNASGTVEEVNITRVVVQCVDVPVFTVGGTVSGLDGDLVLEMNNGPRLTLTQDGSFRFSESLLKTGLPYELSIADQPATQNCTLSNASGNIVNADIDNIEVACSAVRHLGSMAACC